MDGLLQRLNGMFVFALHDARTNEVFIARDRLGIKPLYLGEFSGTVVFGSELKSLILHPSVRRDIDPDSLARYLVMEYVPSPRSIYRGIGKVRPGDYVRIAADGDRPRVTHHTYWELDWTKGGAWAHDLELPSDDSEASWSRALLAALRDAVGVRLVSEVPIGGLLSGGLDSSSICALMGRAGARSADLLGRLRGGLVRRVLARARGRAPHTEPTQREDVHIGGPSAGPRWGAWVSGRAVRGRVDPAHLVPREDGEGQRGSPSCCPATGRMSSSLAIRRTWPSGWLGVWAACLDRPR